MNIKKVYRELFRIRRVEEEIARIYPSDKIKSPVHLSIGQEAVSVAVCEALVPGDIVFGTYRSHALYLAKGGDLRAMFAEMYGKVTGCARGKGGSMHLVDIPAGFMGTSAVVGTTIANAVGYAYGLKLQSKPHIVASFFGDGAVDEGAFYESLNFAHLKQVPLIFICENNGYAIHTPQSARQRDVNLCDRVGAYGIPATRIESGDVFEIHRHVQEAADALRSGQPGPFFFECLTYRWKEHVGPNDDFDAGYRSREEAQAWMANDQVRLAGEKLSDPERMEVEQNVEAEIAAAIAFAENSSFPGASELTTDVYEESEQDGPDDFVWRGDTGGHGSGDGRGPIRDAIWSGC